MIFIEKLRVSRGLGKVAVTLPPDQTRKKGRGAAIVRVKSLTTEWTRKMSLDGHQACCGLHGLTRHSPANKKIIH